MDERQRMELVQRVIGQVLDEDPAFRDNLMRGIPIWKNKAIRDLMAAACHRTLAETEKKEVS